MWTLGSLDLHNAVAERKKVTKFENYVFLVYVLD